MKEKSKQDLIDDLMFSDTDANANSIAAAGADAAAPWGASAGAAAGWQVGCRFRLGCCTVWQEGGTGPEPGGGGEGGDLHNVRYTHGSS